MRKFFTPPIFEGDDEKTAVARQLNIMAWFLIAILTLYTVALPIVAPQLGYRLILAVPLYALQIAVLVWVRRGQVRLGSVMAFGGVWLLMAVAAITSGGVRSPFFAGNVVIVVGAAALFGRPSAFVVAGLSLGLGLVMVWAEENGALPPVSATPRSALLLQAIYFLVAAGTLHFATFSISAALKRARQELVERERAEEALHEAQQMYESIFRLSPEVIVVITEADGRYLAANDAHERVTGYRPDEIIGHTSAEFEILDSSADRQKVLRLLRHQGVVRNMEVRFRRRSGEPYTALLSVAPVELGGERCLVTMVTDITERKQTEEEIRRLNQFLDSVIDNANIWLDVLNEKAEVVIWNKAAEEISGYSREEVTGHGQIWQWLYPDETYRNQVVAEAMAIIESGGDEQDAETTIRRKDGQTRIISWNSRRLVDEAGTPAGSIALGRDITERKQAEEARARLATAIEQSAESVVITDTDSTILYVNPAFERISGYGRAEAIGQNPRILKSGKQNLAFYRELWATITAGQVWQGRLVNRKKDGSLYTEEATISPVRDERGAIVNYVAVKRDVTRELQLEEQYYQAQKMEAVGRLTAGVAHDFNNLLTAINGFSALISLELAPDDPLQESVKKVLDSGQRAAGLVRQLLAFSRKQIVRPAVLNLNEEIANVDKMLRRVIGEDIELTASLAPGLWLTKADPTQLEQVIVNLAVNARDAMPQGGRLTIETANVTLDDLYAADHPGTQAGEYILLAVSDTGVGMNEEVKSHLFEPFFTTKELGQGTGLGLAIVYGIVKQSSGDVQVYSEEGIGTTFKVYLPRVGQAVTLAARPPAGPEMPAGSETILLVEDDEGVRELARRVLHSLGYILLETRDGQEALRLAAGHSSPIHLLLTDVVLPDVSGQALAEQLAQTHPGLRMLFMSGYTGDAIAQHGVLDPGIAFLQKPFSPMDLARQVRAALDA